MIKTTTQEEFTRTMTREDNGFSFEGAKALFDYLEQLEADCNISYEFDPIAIRCEYVEYDNLAECLHDYDCGDDTIRENGLNLKTVEDISEHTMVIEVPGTDKLIIQAF
jgi:hypothetical protein